MDTNRHPFNKKNCIESIRLFSKKSDSFVTYRIEPKVRSKSVVAGLYFHILSSTNRKV